MIDKPTPFREALDFILDKNPDPSAFDAERYALLEPQVRERAFFSSNVESARFLQRAKDLVADFIGGATEEVVGPDGVKRRALKNGSRADFVRRMREFMVAEGMATEEELGEINQGDVRELASRQRLRLIFDTNTRQAYGYGDHVQSMEAATLYRFPAARFVREFDVLEPRPRHAAGLGDVRLKTDTKYWAEWQNGADIGGFEVPYPPFGFNSGMGMEDVSREDAIALGLDVSSVTPPGELPGLNDDLKASSNGLDPDLKQRLLDQLNNKRAELRERSVNAQEAALRAAARAKRRAERRNGPKYADLGESIVKL